MTTPAFDGQQPPPPNPITAEEFDQAVDVMMDRHIVAHNAWWSALKKESEAFVESLNAATFSDTFKQAIIAKLMKRADELENIS